jgi:hypothetical protein
VKSILAVVKMAKEPLITHQKFSGTEKMDAVNLVELDTAYRYSREWHIHCR